MDASIPDWLVAAHKKGMALDGFHSILRVEIHKSFPAAIQVPWKQKKCQKTAMPMHGIL